MTVLTHMVVGGAVGSFVDWRGVAFGLGVASHVPLDVIPHYEFKNMWLEVVIVGSFFGVMLATGHAGTGFFWGALGAVIPDLENLLWRLGFISDDHKIFPGHSARFQRFLPHGRSLGVRNAWWQVAIGVCAVAVTVWRAGIV